MQKDTKFLVFLLLIMSWLVFYLYFPAFLFFFLQCNLCQKSVLFHSPFVKNLELSQAARIIRWKYRFSKQLGKQAQGEMILYYCWAKKKNPTNMRNKICFKITLILVALNVLKSTKKKIIFLAFIPFKMYFFWYLFSILIFLVKLNFIEEGSHRIL